MEEKKTEEKVVEEAEEEVVEETKEEEVVETPEEPIEEDAEVEVEPEPVEEKSECYSVEPPKRPSKTTFTFGTFDCTLCGRRLKV